MYPGLLNETIALNSYKIFLLCLGSIHVTLKIYLWHSFSCQFTYACNLYRTSVILNYNCLSPSSCSIISCMKLMSFLQKTSRYFSHLINFDISQVHAYSGNEMLAYMLWKLMENVSRFALDLSLKIC